MKPTHRNPLLRNFVLAATTLFGFASISYGADLFWDANGDTSTAVGGTGNWSATGWRSTSTTGALGVWSDGNRPVFNTTAGIVTLDQNVAADGISFGVQNSEIRGSGTNAITFSGGTITSSMGGQDITALLAGSVIFNPTAGTLSNATTFNVKANNTGLTSVELNAGGANANMIIDNAGAFGPGGASPATVKLTAGILNIGALTTELIGSATANGSGGNLSLNAWTTELAGGTIRSRTGANTWNGPTTLTADSGLMTRALAGISLTFSSTATINLDSFTLTSSSDLTASGIYLQGNITGTGKIATGNFNGGGTLNPGGYTVLSGTNDYEGGTDVNYGSLVFLNAASKPAIGDVNVAAGATLGLGIGASPNYFTATDIDALFAGTWSGVTLASTSNVGFDTSAGDFEYAGSSGAVGYGLSKLGANKLTLTGINAYTGPTNVFGGSIALSGSGTFGSGALTLAGGTVDLGGQSLSIGALSVVSPAATGETITAGSLTTSGTVATSYAVSNTSGNAIIAANLLANSTAGLTKTGAGALTLSGANTYTGGTTVSAGNITFLKAASLPATGTVTVPAASTVAFGVGSSSTYFTGADVVALLGGTLTQVSNSTAYTVGINTAAEDCDISNDIGPSTHAITKQGANVLTLSGNNTFDKLITVSEGTLKAGSSTAFNNTSTLAVLPSTTLDLNGFDAKFISMTSNTGTITTTGVDAGTDTLTLSASNADGIGNLFTDDGTRKLKLDFTSAASPAAARQATTNVNNTYSGGLILGNLMRLQVPAGTIGTPGNITSGALGCGTVTINGGPSNSSGAQIWFSADNRTLVNHVIVNGNAGNGTRSGSFRIMKTGCTISGNIDANATNATFGADATGVTLALTGKLTGNSGFSFFQSGGGTFTTNWVATLNNATDSPNDYAGPTAINNSQTTLKLGAADQIPDGDGKGNVAVNYGKLDLNGFDETINGLSGGATAVVDNIASGTTNTLTLGAGDATGSTFAGVITNTTGTLSLFKFGTGTQTLSGANSYSGTTTVEGGTLLINGNQGGATGAVQVYEATLGGNGTVGGEVSIAQMGTIAPGSASATIGQLNVSANVSVAGTYACDINATTSDKLAVTGNLDLSGSTLVLNSLVAPTADSYTIATYTGTLTAELTPSTTLPEGYSLNYNTPNEVKLVKTATGGYAGWASTNAGDQAADLDFDNDGVANGVEYFLGAAGSSSILNKTATWTNGGNIDPSAYGTQFVVQTSTNLVSWADVPANDPNLSNSAGSVSYTLSGSGKEFMRLKVTPN